MSRGAVRRIGFFCFVSLLALVFGAVLTSPGVLASRDTRKEDDPLARDLYAETIARYVLDETELADTLALDLLQFGKLLPPAEDFQTSLHNGVIPYDPVVFPTWIFDRAVPVSVYGVPAFAAELSPSQTNFNIWGLDLSGTLQGAGGVGGLVAVAQNGDTYYPAFDANGNITEYVGTNGTVVAHREYSPFGLTTALTGAKKDDYTHWWSTKPWDAVTGLSEYEMRKFEAELGRFLNRDPSRLFCTWRLWKTGARNVWRET